MRESSIYSDLLILVGRQVVILLILIMNKITVESTPISCDLGVKE